MRIPGKASLFGDATLIVSLAAFTSYHLYMHTASTGAIKLAEEYPLPGSQDQISIIDDHGH